MDEQNGLLQNGNLINSTPINIIFSEINYVVTCNKTKVKKNILKNASGEFRSGKLTAIIGQSGAGKTSLLNILAGKRVKGVTGKIFINEEVRNINKFRENSCCIEQEVSMLPLLTVRETLTVACNLKLPSALGTIHKSNVITDIVEKLSLETALDTRVANLSGGELKRLSIGVELITNPPVMFFDEPTSGLDSISSNIVISHLQALAKSGRTMICVIHQPSSVLFDLFDDVLVVSKGKSIYSGPIASMVAYFEGAGFTCPQYYNRADYALEVAMAKGEMEEKLIKKMEELNDSISSKINEISNNTESTPTSSDHVVNVDPILSSIDESSTYAVSQPKQFLILLKRSALCTFRDLHLTRIRVLAHALVGIMLGLIYLDIGNEASKVMSNIALLFFFVLFIFFANSMPTVLTFPLEASVFKREYHNNWYSLPAYFFSKMLADFPLQIICPSVFVLIAYFMSGQPTDIYRILMVWIVCILFTILSQLIGLVTGVVFDMQMGIFLLPALSIPMLLFSGFFIRFNDVPKYMKFFVYLSEFGYSFEAIALAIYGFDRPDMICSTGFCPFKYPEKLLDELDMLNGSYSNNVYVLAAWILFLQIALLAALKYRVTRSL